MSYAGQQMDPVMALASQQATPPPQAQFDPVQALAAGQRVAAPITPASLPQKQPFNGPAIADPSGSFSAGLRNFMNGLSFNLADPAAAAIGAITPALNGYASTKPTYGQRFDELLKWSRGDTAAGQQAHPIISTGAAIAGGIANPVNKLLPVPQSLGGAVLQGAGMGAAYGAGGSIGTSKDLQDAAIQTGLGGLTGGVAGAAGYGLGKLISGATRTPDAQLLADEGVPLTVGQGLGGTGKTLEDASTHVPMMGNAIKSRQLDAISGFNRAAYNRALEPLGVQYPDSAPVGNEGIQAVGRVIGNAYDQAYNGASIAATPQFTGDIQQAVANAANTLPKERVNIIQNNIDRLINSKIGPNGVLAPADLQYAKNWFAEQARGGSSASLDEKAISGAYGEVADALKSAVAQSDPNRGALLAAADKAYMRFARVANAASSNNASGRGGLFTAAQLGQALRSMDDSTRKLSFAKGLAPMQDLAQAGQAVLPSSVPDSGTALRGLLELGAAGAVGHAVAPETALGAAGLIGGGTALYSKPGQKLANAVLFGAPQTRAALGRLPMRALPGVLAALPLVSPSRP